MRKRIGDLLVERGILRPDGLARALERSGGSGARLVSEVVDAGLAPEGRVVEVLSDTQGVPGVDISRTRLATEHLSLIPREIAGLERILPLAVESGRLLLAMADPQNAQVIGEVQLISGLEVMPHVAVASRLDLAVTAAYAALDAGKATWGGAQAPADVFLAVHTPAALPPEETDDVPIEVDPLDEAAVAGDDEEEEEIGSVSARTGPRLVLVVDDEEEILNLCAKALEKRGYRVEKARRGREALEKVNELVPDLVLLDANLPEVHGFDICRKLKSNRRFARMPVIMMTAVYRGWRFAHDIRESFGADDYVEKPFRLEDLLRRVDHHLQRAIGEPERNRELADKLYQEGVALLEKGQAAQAAETFQKAVEADAFSARLHYQLGRALQAAGDAWGAIAAYEKSADLRPDLFAALRSLAALYQQKGFKRKAIEAWERAIPAAPDEPTRQKIKANLLALL